MFNDSIESAMFTVMNPKARKMRPASLILCLLIAGCSHVTNPNPKNVSRPGTNLEQGIACCTSYSQLKYKILPENYRATLSLDAEDPILDLDSGKTYVEALALPETDETILLEIESVVTRRNLRKPSSALYPIVTLLNASHQPVVTLDELPFTFDTTLGTYRHLHMVITLDDRYPDVRYALIHSNDLKITQALSTQKPIRIIKQSDFDSMVYVQPTISRKRIQFSNKGVINVLAYVEGSFVPQPRQPAIQQRGSNQQ
jgi:hypothetical protein